MQSLILPVCIFLCKKLIVKNKAIIIQHLNGFISSFAEYITAFYLKREKEGQAANKVLPTDAQINETFTQQVTYARVKLQRSAALI